MNCVIVCVGKLKEEWQTKGINEYLKRLSRYGRYTIEEIRDESDPKDDSQLLIEKAMDKEGKQILSRIKRDDHVVCLAIKGREFDSPGLAANMKRLEMTGKRIVFVIGGSNGLSGEVMDRADEKWSFSLLTFPHGLMRVILLEQLYRGEKINAGEKYHK